MADNTPARTRQTERLTRKQRRELGRRIWSEHPGLEVVHRDAAGIDIGSEQHYVAVGRTGTPNQSGLSGASPRICTG
jgi:hypothetical protein